MVQKSLLNCISSRVKWFPMSLLLRRSQIQSLCFDKVSENENSRFEKQRLSTQPKPSKCSQENLEDRHQSEKISCDANMTKTSTTLEREK